MKKISVLICFLLLAAIFLYGCNSNESGNASSDFRNDEQIVSAATDTSLEFNGSDVQRTIYQFNEIPSEFWAPEIEMMEPIKVYSHNNNIAIVLVDTETEEEGIYVYVPFSSYLPENDDSTEYTAIEEDVYEFIRKK